MSGLENIDELISKISSATQADCHKKKEIMNYYAILGVDKNATQMDIKLAYQRKLKTHHPDKTEQTLENIAK